jgi:hypothetical protein
MLSLKRKNFGKKKHRSSGRAFFFQCYRCKEKTSEKRNIGPPGLAPLRGRVGCDSGSFFSFPKFSFLNKLGRKKKSSRGKETQVRRTSFFLSMLLLQRKNFGKKKGRRSAPCAPAGARKRRDDTGSLFPVPGSLNRSLPPAHCTLVHLRPAPQN